MRPLFPPIGNCLARSIEPKRQLQVVVDAAFPECLGYQIDFCEAQRHEAVEAGLTCARLRIESALECEHRSRDGESGRIQYGNWTVLIQESLCQCRRFQSSRFDWRPQSLCHLCLRGTSLNHHCLIWCRIQNDSRAPRAAGRHTGQRSQETDSWHFPGLTCLPGPAFRAWAPHFLPNSSHTPRTRGPLSPPACPALAEQRVTQPVAWPWR